MAEVEVDEEEEEEEEEEFDDTPQCPGDVIKV